MARTLDEKYNYNFVQESGFSYGYCAGVRYYRGYAQGAPVDKQKHMQFIDDMKSGAKKYSWCKGFMCGIRDAANERKARKK